MPKSPKPKKVPLRSVGDCEMLLMDEAKRDDFHEFYQVTVARLFEGQTISWPKGDPVLLLPADKKGKP